MTYVGKGYGDRDGNDGKYGLNQAQCLAWCKEKYLQDNSWNGCAHKASSNNHCERHKNVRGFHADNRYDFWRLGENLFVF